MACNASSACVCSSHNYSFADHPRGPQSWALLWSGDGGPADPETWLRTVETDLQPMNLGLASAKRCAQDRAAWRQLVTMATSMTSPWRRPSYLCQFAKPYTPSRNLSLNQNMLVVNRAHSAFAERSFGHTSATACNSLPAKCRNCLALTVETFRKCLKTYLFKTAFITTA